MENSTIKKDIANYILDKIQHNPDHSIKFVIKGREILACARCTGFTIGFFVGISLLSIFYLTGIHINNFILIFTISWIFVIPSILDWGSVKLSIRKGNNPIRFFVGYLQGIGYAIYLVMLPIHIIFRIITLAMYETILFSVRKYIKKKVTE